MFFDLWRKREGSPRYYEFYIETFNEASRLETKIHNEAKYSKIEKPVYNPNHEIISVDSQLVSICGFDGDVYEAKFVDKEKNKELFLHVDKTTIGGYLIADISIFNNDPEIVRNHVLEEYSSFKKTSKSKYYDIIYQVELAIDGCNDNLKINSNNYECISYITNTFI